MRGDYSRFAKVRTCEFLMDRNIQYKIKTTHQHVCNFIPTPNAGGTKSMFQDVYETVCFTLGRGVLRKLFFQKNSDYGDRPDPDWGSCWANKNKTLLVCLRLHMKRSTSGTGKEEGIRQEFESVCVLLWGGRHGYWQITVHTTSCCVLRGEEGRRDADLMHH